jgi:hypoxanthine phosphoribosyltransferase
MKKLFLNWDDVAELVDILCKKIDTTKYNGLFGVPRGGLIPAVMISHKTGLPLVNSIGDKILIIDDIVDTGETLKSINNNIACLHKKPHTITQPTFYANIVENTVWVVYPWELSNSSEIRDNTFNN